MRALTLHPHLEKCKRFSCMFAYVASDIPDFAAVYSSLYYNICTVNKSLSFVTKGEKWSVEMKITVCPYFPEYETIEELDHGVGVFDALPPVSPFLDVVYTFCECLTVTYESEKYELHRIVPHSYFDISKYCKDDLQHPVNMLIRNVQAKHNILEGL